MARLSTGTQAGREGWGRRTRAASRILRRARGKEGRPTALLVSPDEVGIPFIWAASALGGSVSPLNPRWTAEELGRAIRVLEPELLVVGPGHAPPPLPAGCEGVDAGVLSRESALPPTGEEGDEASPDGAGEGTEWILWTSGSTGEPRGVVLSGAAFEASARAVRLRLGLTSGDRWLASLSPAHVGGLALLLRARTLGAGLVPWKGFDAEGFGELVEREGVTHASLVPTQLLQLLEARGDRPLPSVLQGLLLGGAAASGELLERARTAAVPLALTWGTTEAASQIATAPPPLVAAKPGTVGPPLEGFEVRRDPTEGELHVRGPTLARGRFAGPGRPVESLVDAEGWYRTGDVGRFDEDGHLWITGRVSHRIVTGGVTVEPGAVEAALESLSEIREAVVLGIPDPRWGERVVAVVVPAEPGRPPSLEELDPALRRCLSPSKRPRALVVVDELPRTATGKVDRRRLRQLFPAESGPDSAPR